MAVTAFDGFDTYAAVTTPDTGIAGVWNRTTSFNLSYVAGRYGGNAVRLGSSSGDIYRLAGFSQAEFAFAFNFRNTSSQEKSFHVSYDNAVHLSAVLTSTGRLQLTRTNGNYGGSLIRTLLAETPVNAIPLNTWIHMALAGRVDNSNGQITVWINGNPTPLLSVTGVDTAAAATVLANSFGFSGEGLEIDDWYADNGGIIQLPERRALFLPANADGATLNLVPSTGATHFGVVDENPPVLTDWLSGTNVGDFSDIGLTDLPVTPSAIDAVRAIMIANKTDVASRAAALDVKSGATVSTGPDFYLSTNALRTERLLLTDPATGLAFVPAGVNALELRPRVAV